MPMKASYLLLIGAGGIVIYSGVKGKGLGSAIRAVISGQSPATATSAHGITPAGYDTALEGSIPGTSGTRGFASNGIIAAAWVACGGPANTAVFASQVAQAESSGSATATSPNPDGGTNVGWFQLDTRGVGSGYSVAQLKNPILNTRITVKVTNGGIDWQEWSDPVVDSLPGGVYTP